MTDVFLNIHLHSHRQSTGLPYFSDAALFVFCLTFALIPRQLNLFRICGISRVSDYLGSGQNIHVCKNGTSLICSGAIRY